MVELPDTWRCIWCERLLLTQDTDTCDECSNDRKKLTDWREQ